MRAKSNEKSYNRNYLYKAGLLTSMYPDSKPNPNLNQNYKQFANVQKSSFQWNFYIPFLIHFEK